MDGKIWVEFEEFSHQYCCTFQLMLYICLEDLYLYSVQFSSVVKSCPALCNPTDCSIPGFPVQHQLPELAQTHIHRVGVAIQPSHPLSSPSSPAFSLCQHQVFSNEPVLRIRQPKNWSFSFSFSSSNAYSELISLLSKGLSRVFSNTTVKSINSLVLNLLYGPTLTSIHGYWKTSNFDQMDLCLQSNVSAF